MSKNIAISDIDYAIEITVSATNVRVYPKINIKAVGIDGDKIVLYTRDSEVKIKYDDIGSPASANITELKNILVGYIGNPATPGKISTVNSSTTPLLADGVFTGTAEDLKDTSVIIVSLKSDVASATDGLSIQFSPDGTNWSGSDDFTVPANSGKTYSFQPANRYFRVVYTNGGSDQTFFRLQTQLKPNYVKPSSHRIQDSIIDDDDAELIKAVLTGKANGTFVNVNCTADGNLTISDNSSGLAIAKGDVTGHSLVHKFGSAPDFDTTDGEVTVWDGAEDGTAWEKMVYNFSTSADIDSISSSDSGDSQNIEIQGLDSNYDLVVQNATLNGQNRVALSTSLIRVFRVKNVGSTDFAGHIFVFVNGTLTGGVPDNVANIRAVVQPENNQTEMAVYTIPNGKTGYLRSWYASTAGASKSTNYIIRVFARSTGGVFQLKHRASLADAGSSHIQHKYSDPIKFVAKTDLIMTAEMTEAGATGGAIAGGFDIVLVND